jgi:hypothetical protein
LCDEPSAANLVQPKPSRRKKPTTLNEPCSAKPPLGQFVGRQRAKRRDGDEPHSYSFEELPAIHALLPSSRNALAGTSGKTGARLALA